MDAMSESLFMRMMKAEDIYRSESATVIKAKMLNSGKPDRSSGRNFEKTQSLTESIAVSLPHSEP